LKKGDVVLVDFTAKELVQGTTFETTIEKDAKEAGVFNPNATYKPVPMIIGKKDLFPLLDAELEKMSLEEEKTIELEPKDAFGERSAGKIALLTLQEFKKQKMHPIPGMVIEADGRQGKVQSVSGGRVRVDFNHPLAGKKVEYKLVMRKKIDDRAEQVSVLLEKFFPHVKNEERKITVTGEKAEIELPERLKEQKETEMLKQFASKTLPEELEWLKTVEFTENKSKKKEEKVPASETIPVETKKDKMAEKKS
jgi:FKBP-type peptidyl-prolyl cis-trans isomerase 2